MRKKNTPYIESLSSPRIDGFEWQEPQNNADQKAYRDILEHGCHILQIYADDSDPPQLDYYFSIGFYLNLAHPEILIMGMTPTNTSEIINNIFAYIKSGNALRDGDFLSYKIDGEQVRFAVRNISKNLYLDYFGYANWFYRSLLYNVNPVMEHKYPVIQLVWPDHNGFYPWNDECNPDARRMQTLNKLNI